MNIVPRKTKPTTGLQTPEDGRSKFRSAMPDSPILSSSFVVGGQPPRKPSREPETSPEAAALEQLIQSAPVATDEELDMEVPEELFCERDGRLFSMKYGEMPVETLPDGTKREVFSEFAHPENVALSKEEFEARVSAMMAANAAPKHSSGWR